MGGPRPAHLFGARVLGGLYLVDWKAPIWCIKFSKGASFQPRGIPGLDYLFQGYRDDLEKMLPSLKAKMEKEGLTEMSVHRVFDWDVVRR